MSTCTKNEKLQISKTLFLRLQKSFRKLGLAKESGIKDKIVNGSDSKLIATTKISVFTMDFVCFEDKQITSTTNNKIKCKAVPLATVSKLFIGNKNIESEIKARYKELFIAKSRLT